MTRGGAVLVGILYPVIVAAGVLLLAATQLRSSSGSAFDTWRLNYTANRALAATLDKDIKDSRQQMLQNLDYVSYTNVCLSYFNKDGTWKNTLSPQLVDDALAARKAGKKAQDVEDDVRCLLRGYSGHIYDAHLYESRSQRLEAEIADLEKAAGTNNEQFVKLVEGHQDFVAFMEMEKFWASRFIAVIPYDLMVLLLVMFMGALGGMVRLLRDYGDQHRTNPSAGDYLFVPLIGFVVAIGGYILAKTSLLLLSSTHTEASLSPFMVGLVGIVSGLLARDMIDAISRAGRKIVSGKADAGGHRDHARS